MENIAILGAGEMGTWFAEKYRDLGRDVTISDLDLSKAEGIAAKLGIDYGTNKEAIGKADEVVIAVSLDATVDIIAKHRHDLRDKIVYDIASVKDGITERLAELGQRTISLHPMWGGATSGFSGQNMLIIPTHSLDNHAYLDFFAGYENFFRLQGVNVKRVANEGEHDKLMAETLAVYHFGMMVLGSTISGNGLSLEEHRRVIGTTATLGDASIESVVHSNPKLYFEIQNRNPYFPEVMQRFVDAAKELQRTVGDGDRGKFTQIMKSASNYFRNGMDEKSYLALAKGKFMAAVDAIRGVK